MVPLLCPCPEAEYDGGGSVWPRSREKPVPAGFLYLLFLFFFSFLFFVGRGVLGFEFRASCLLSSKTHHLSHTLSPYVFSVFSDRVLHFLLWLA
jgi:hypothetical protein